MRNFVQRNSGADYTADWATPADIFRELDDEFHFNLDPCSTDQNAKCERHYTIAEDGLQQNWGGIAYFATRHITKSGNGLEKHIRNL